MLVSEPLRSDHVLDGFDSGRPELDAWLTSHARTAEAARTGRTFVWADGDAVVAFFTIAAHLLERETLPNKWKRSGPAQVPAVLVAKLALSRPLHGQGLGGALLSDALTRIAAATQTVAARFVVVDALDQQVAEFYEHYGFQRIAPRALRLVRKIDDVVADVGLA